MRKRKDDETLSLFDVVEPKEITGPKVDVVRLDYVTAEPMTWQELFEGYQKLRAIHFPPVSISCTIFSICLKMRKSYSAANL